MARDSRATRVTMQSQDDDQGLKASGEGDQQYQGRDLDRLEQYGLASEPPANTEVVQFPGDPLPVGHERPVRPSGVPALAVSESCLYGPDGNYVRMLADGTVQVIPKSGKQVLLGDTTGTKDVAYADSANATASKVASGPTLETWTDNVYRDIEVMLRNNITTGLLRNHATLIAQLATFCGTLGFVPAPPLLVAAYPTATTLADGIPEDTDHSYVSSGSTTTEVKP